MALNRGNETNSRPARLLLGLLASIVLACFGLVGTANAANFDVTWVFGMVQPDLVLEVGDTVTFNFASNHTVEAFPDFAAFNACDFSNSMSLAVSGPYVKTFDTPGVFYFGCSVNSGNHCTSGNMSLQVTVNAPGVPGVSPWALVAVLCAIGMGSAAYLRRRATPR